jgi:hypothetical protein
MAASARSVAGTLMPYNELLVAASATNALAGLISEVHPDAAILDAARDCEQEVLRFYVRRRMGTVQHFTLATVSFG